MYAFNIGDLEQVMKLPVPFRKWLIERWNKQKEKEHKMQGHKDPTEPLSPQEKAKMLKDSQRAQSDPANMYNFMQSMRNRK